MVRRARLIYNPSSGREEVKRRVADILHKLEKGGFETSAHATGHEGDATLAAAEAVDRGFDLIVAAGGDGTLHEVINGMAGKPIRPYLGIVPMGTTNDLARALGIPKQWEAACELILRRETMAVDVGKINQTYFINIAGGGSLTELTYEVPSKLKTVLGQLAYYMKGIEKLPRLKPIEMKFETPQGTIEEKIMLFLIANSNSIGGFEKLAPQASLNDGLFDVFILKQCNLADFIRIVSLTLRGEHLDDEHLIYFQTDWLTISANEHTQLNLDGEFGGTLPCTFSVLPNHLNIFIDKSGQSGYHDKYKTS